MLRTTSGYMLLKFSNHDSEVLGVLVPGNWDFWEHDLERIRNSGLRGVHCWGRELEAQAHAVEAGIQDEVEICDMF